ncbi:MAG TPA: twitching motility protein PilT [Patescibacteria group bacterium]|nr:twitching motility protein PilT [Patescibacteria group bacterium]
MVKFIIGVKGSGKTKRMIDMANEATKTLDGSVVYIDRDKKHIYDLDKNIRFIEAGEFQMTSLKSLYGFICGVISQNYDIQKVYLDGHKLISEAKDDCMEEFINNLKRIAEQFEIDFVLSCSRAKENIPNFMEPYII